VAAAAAVAAVAAAVAVAAALAVGAARGPVVALAVRGPAAECRLAARDYQAAVVRRRLARRVLDALRNCPRADLAAGPV
jgi:hypothetical protein